MTRTSILEFRVIATLNQIERRYRLPELKREYRFHPVRMWRFDFAYPDKKVAIECEGGVWTQGRHTRGAHYGQDCDKYNAAVLLGWKVLRYTTNTLPGLEKDLPTLLSLT